MKLLLDVHIPIAVAHTLRRRVARLDVAHASTWRASSLREAEDEVLLSACAQDRRVFVTYDLATVPDLLNDWAQEGRDHSGVFFGDANSIPPERVGIVAAAIAILIEESGESDMTNVVRFLQLP